MRYFHNAVLTQSIYTPPGGGGGGGARSWFADGIPSAPTPASLTTGSGVVRNVANYSQWVTQSQAAQPGDVINITAVISGRNYGSATLKWDGRAGQGWNGVNGTASNPIVITCSGSGEIRSEVHPVGGSGFPEGLALQETNHVHVVGCKIFGGQFAFRFISSHGTSGSPVKLWHNDVSGSRDAAFYVGSASVSDGSGGLKESSHVSVKYNTIRDSQGTVEFNEGIYIGVGTTNLTWQDDTHDVEVAYNDIYNHAGDGIDIKLGVYNLSIHHNKVHDVSAQFGSGITVGATNPAVPDNPNPSLNANIEVYNNWVWNIGYDRGGNGGVPFGAYMAKPGTKFYNNVMWSIGPNSGGRGISSISFIQEGSQPIQIYNNTILIGGGNTFVAGGSGSTLNLQYSNNLALDTTQGSTVVSSGDFIGPIPATHGADNRANVTADAGNGPGSAFIPNTGASNIVGQASGTTSTIDITDVARPQGGSSERGAYELIP